MGDLIYICNIDKFQYICTIDKMRELQLNPKNFQLLLPMLQYEWSGNRIRLLTACDMEHLYGVGRKWDDVTEYAREVQKEYV